ncbi:MAG: prenyltransferase, partial [Caldimonas sp.]
VRTAMQIQDHHAADAVAPGPTTFSELRAWIRATRPHTLTIGINPVLVGCGLAWRQTGHIDFAVMLMSMLGALLLQTGTNLDNDVSDFERGTDRAGHLGLRGRPRLAC